jgi:hypothetical protein
MAFLIGLSLGFCIQDVLNKYILEDEILYIITNTRAVTEDDWRSVEKECLRCHWNDDIEGAEIMARLREAGKIIQPGLTDPKFRTTLDKGRWFVNIHGKEVENEKVPSGAYGFGWIHSISV